MQLLIAVVQSDDAGQLCRRLNEEGFRATRIASTGGFLAIGNATVLVGVEDAAVEAVVSIIREVCHTRRTFINSAPWTVDSIHVAASTAAPMEVLVGGAAIFSVPVRRFVRLRGGTAPPLADEGQVSAGQAEAADGMDLVLAIVSREDASAVIRALLAAGYRLTHLTSAGTFLRRGNVTLIVGVEREKVDHVLELIQRNCQFRPEPKPPEAGIPMYSATVFILETQRLICQ